ncbi:hypothetical protein Sgly_3149 [Syntrophobotulus glycolicus DSM 8271]|uniref:Uncharacterized protein n=1 Tax=Syntrophobotulus glycolicus (strain DSM 8271 / FlGlyR) TaxID=645991 RepID=F0SX46_SYNGF|nr:hypothetical protein Sgly_2627 [Syntrophobotulus glycolicus DSM 8271]ADY57243.1 hypothetical protein Sgly_2974 [Syntrophobotulus glycolicus DSM 8271]ADY57415.1 hypothetical protein Sgly_3149 [Syntrophobotulus glycolicus DSM 8271]
MVNVTLCLVKFICVALLRIDSYYTAFSSPGPGKSKRES